MTERQILLVKKTWRLFQGINPTTTGDAFYSKLFADKPALRKMFPAGMNEQYRKLFDMLTAIVVRLDKLDQMSDEIEAMAKRHVKYGVKAAHYQYVGNALLWTLEKGLGSDWNHEVKGAWTVCYNLISEKMIKSAYA